MNKISVIEPDAKRKPAPEFDEAKERELAELLGKWRAEASLGAGEERQLALLLKALAISRVAEVLEVDGFIRLVQPLAGEAELSDDEKQALVRQVKPLLKFREPSKDEKEELAKLFDHYHMRLWSKLRRSIGAALESQFEPHDVLSEAYIRAETRWSSRPEDPEKSYVWLYGIVHDQYCDMLRKVHAGKRGGLAKHVRISDNSVAEFANELWQSQTGASTIASRNEFISRFQEFLERKVREGTLTLTDLEIFSMRVFDRLEYRELVGEIVRRAEESSRAADYQKILAELDSRSRDDDRAGQDVDKRRADAIRQRFNRAVKKLIGAILAEFPEILDALPDLPSLKV